MSGPLFISILATGFAVAFLHGALPNHWLPFVLVGRRQSWSAGKTLAITACAGVAHSAITIVLGLVLVGAGMAIGGRVLSIVAGGLLIALGVFYLTRTVRGDGHLHLPFVGRLAPVHGAPPEEIGAQALTDRSAILGLLAVLALSPCEAFLPVYLSGLKFGWAGFFTLSLVLTAAAMTSMTGLTGLSLAGARWLGLKAVGRFEGALLGGALIMLGVVVIALER
jgi:hypothetical protein